MTDYRCARVRVRARACAYVGGGRSVYVHGLRAFLADFFGFGSVAWHAGIRMCRDPWTATRAPRPVARTTVCGCSGHVRCKGRGCIPQQEPKRASVRIVKLSATSSCFFDTAYPWPEPSVPRTHCSALHPGDAHTFRAAVSRGRACSHAVLHGNCRDRIATRTERTVARGLPGSYVARAGARAGSEHPAIRT